MLATRFAFLVYFLIVFVLNGGGLLAHLGVVPSLGLNMAVILACNLFSAPVAVWGAYRIGELAEEEYRRKQRP
jgi:hypothetical protein